MRQPRVSSSARARGGETLGTLGMLLSASLPNLQRNKRHMCQRKHCKPLPHRHALKTLQGRIQALRSKRHQIQVENLAYLQKCIRISPTLCQAQTPSWVVRHVDRCFVQLSGPSPNPQKMYLSTHANVSVMIFMTTRLPRPTYFLMRVNILITVRLAQCHLVHPRSHDVRLRVQRLVLPP